MAPRWPGRLFWIDGLAALTAGTLVFLAHAPLAEWYGLPPDLMRLMGMVNLAYATYSLSLAMRPDRPKPLIVFLVAANLAWAVTCLRWAAAFADTASPLGLGHLVGEAVFVSVLAGLEWRYRERLRVR